MMRIPSAPRRSHRPCGPDVSTPGLSTPRRLQHDPRGSNLHRHHHPGDLAAKGLQIGWSALGGAAVALLLGVVSLGDIPVVWNIVWNATATFVAVIIISLLLDEAGFFEWAALHVGRWGGGQGRRLFVLFVLLGAAGGGPVRQ